MNKPDILGVEVLTPDGRGNILSLHGRRVTVGLNCIKPKQVLTGSDRGNGGLHRSYVYKDVQVIKGRYCFNDDRIKLQYED